MTERQQFTNTETGLLILAPAKLNLSLLIAGKRPDGFHNIETIMAKIDFFDEILIESTAKDGIELICTGPEWAPDGPDNLICKAARLLLDHTGIDANLRITLTKNIPAGSGLGSASSDAAATLLGLNRLLKLGLTADELLPLAEQLGSDVPFFLYGNCALCTGKGEKIKKINYPLDFRAILIATNVNVSTARVYANYKHDKALYERLKKQIKGLLQKNRIDLITNMCANMLLFSCFEVHEELAELKVDIEALGIRPLQLSGSGSAMFCVIEKQDEQAVLTHRHKLERLHCNSRVVCNISW